MTTQWGFSYYDASFRFSGTEAEKKEEEDDANTPARRRRKNLNSSVYSNRITRWT